MILFGLLHLNAKSPLSRLLDSRPAVFVGVLSYSLYLWQQPFTDSRLTGQSLPWQVNAVCIFVAAGLSYALIERPFLRLKTRLA